jgi:transposase
MADADPVQERPAKVGKSLLTRIQDGASLFRDLGVIIGIPTIVVVGLRLYDIQQQSFDALVKADASTIKSLEAQISILKETQFDHALSLIKSQNELFTIERNEIISIETKRIRWANQVMETQNRNMKAYTEWMVDLTDIINKAIKNPSINSAKELEKLKPPDVSVPEPPPR